MNVFLRRLKHDDGDGVIEDRFSKDNGVEFGIHFISVEDGEYRDGIGSRKGSADGEGFNEADVEAVNRDKSPEVQDRAEDKGRNESTGKGKREDSANIPEEIRLYICISC